MQIQPVSTLFDEFLGSTLDTTKWYTFADENTGVPGANTMSIANSAITMTQAGTADWQLISVNNFTWDNSQLVWGPITGQWYMYLPNGRARVQGGTLYLDGPFPGSGTSMAYNATTMKYFKFVNDGSSEKLFYSANNNNWTQAGTYTINITGSTMAPKIGTVGNGTTFTLGAVNPLPNAAPIASIISPDDLTVLSSATPTLSFDAQDPDSDKVTYQLQIATVKDFSTVMTDVLSASSPGFSAGDPYNSGATVTYTVQSALTSGGIHYYWRVRAKDPAGKNEFGPWSPIYTMISQPNPPVVTSGTTSSITSTTVSASGEVTSDGGGVIIERGIVYGTSVNPTISGSKKVATGTTGTFSVPITGLVPNTIYNWRAYATNSRATSYGSNLTFTTLPGIVTINSIGSITHNSAIVNSTIETNGGATITERGVVYSTVPNPTLANNKVVSGSGAGTYNTTISGLTGNSDYYVRAYATNASGTTYSVQSQFTTLQTPSAPTVLTGTSANIGETTASINGSRVILDGTQTVTERGIVISSTHDEPTTADRKIAASTAGLGTFNVDITALAPETTYYARAYATNSLGTGYGSVVSFTTLALFIPDEGDGYWTYQPYGSSVTISRSQSTPAYASANLLLSDLNLEDGEEYTLWYSSKENEGGEATMILQWYDNFVKMQEVIHPSTPYTFTYDRTKLSWAIRLYVTGEDPQPGAIDATFNDMYLAKESEFSGFIPFVRKGLTEIKLVNNWLLDKRREDTIGGIFGQIKGLGWREFSVKTVGLGWLDIGDQIDIVQDDGTKTAIVWEKKLIMDGGIKENIGSPAPAETETNYEKASRVTKSVRRTQISVDHNAQKIQSLVEDVYSEDGVVNKKFTEVAQDIDSVRTTVQSSGGVNLVKNSVMYSFNDEGQPDFWNVSGTGTLLIQASPESLSAGGISGNVFTLNEKTVTQRIPVLKDVDYIASADKQYYSFSARVRKNTVGNAYISLTNGYEEPHIIELPDQQEFYWEAVKLEGLLPLDDHYVITIYSDSDANLQVTDVMLSPGETIRQWTQANGEAMNTNVAITTDGMTIRSNVFRNDYTKIDALGIEVHKHEAGGERVFGFNGDETTVRKLRAEQQISLAPIRMVPISYGQLVGIAFTRTEEN